MTNPANRVVERFSGETFPGCDVTASTIAFENGSLVLRCELLVAFSVHLRSHGCVATWDLGGDTELGQPDEGALERELMEELGVVAPICAAFETVTHEYDQGVVRIAFYQCRWRTGEPFPHDGQRLQWITRDTLDQFEFPPADERILERLREENRWWRDADAGASC